MQILSHQTKFFYELTPERVLNAIEDSLGVRLTGKTFAHNSMENRVYELWIDHDSDFVNQELADIRRYRSIIAKFYRPGRWNKEQILEEHQFLKELHDEEIDVVRPLTFLDGRTLHQLKDSEIYYSVFPKASGRHAGEPTEEMIRIIGRLLARMHNVGATKPMRHRLTQNSDTYGLDNLRYLISEGKIPPAYHEAYGSCVREICDILSPLFQNSALHRIHGDLHLGNILWNDDRPTILDFDDAVMGSPAQDLWLLLPGRDSYAQDYCRILLEAYRSLRDFDENSLQLIEGLRALRFIHFSTWIARRWDDPSFKRNFPYFGSDSYWQTQLQDLREQLDILRQPSLWMQGNRGLGQDFGFDY
jgi:Ser/Thr protein kinase RdoA (MazF antagonist)